MVEAVRLVIWDLDETFWHGTLTEGGVVWREETAEIVHELARRGIMSTICSKNDFEPVRAILTGRGLWDTFIFPSIDWSPKGPRVQRLVATVQLRPESVLLIDDNPLNLEEAKFFSPGLQTAAETAIPALLTDPRLAGKDDRELSRLKQYKVLEARKADEARFGLSAAVDDEARSTTESSAEFLRASDIRVRIDSDVEAHLDRAIELINRTNQLNFLKRRLPEALDQARQQLRRELSDFTTQAGLIEVADKYGDYGFCGYFQVTTRRDVIALRQFCFSCRTLGMGVEAFIYQRLGRPALSVQGEVLGDPAGHDRVEWIRMVSGEESLGDGAPTGSPPLGSVRIRGGCALWPLVHYFGLSSGEVVGEFNTVREGKLIGLDHSICLRNAILGVTEEQLEAVKPLGYVAEDFQTQFLDHSGPRPIWVFSNWRDSARIVFQHTRTGIAVPYQPPRRDEAVAAHHGLSDYLAAEFSPFDFSEAEFKRTLELIFSKIPSHGLMFVLRAPETRRGEDGVIKPNLARRQRNLWCGDVAAHFPNVRLLSMTDFIEGETEVQNEQLTHFDRKVYHRLYLRVRAEAESSLADTISISAP